MGKVPTVAGVRSRRAWQHSPKGIVLRDAGVTKSTQVRYYNAVSLLGKTVDSAINMEDLDDQVGDWIQQQFQKGAPLNTVADALSGLHFFAFELAIVRDMEKDGSPEPCTASSRGFAVGYGIVLYSELMSSS